MAVLFYPLNKLTEISIGDPRLSIDHLVELIKYDFSKGVLNFMHPAIKKAKKQ